MRGFASAFVGGLVALLVCASAAAAASSGPLPPTSDPFYSYSGSLAGVAPGTVLKSRTISNPDLGVNLPYSASQVLYRTTGELGQPTVTVATIIQPLSGSAATKLVSYQPAYDALGAQCDPSYTLQGGDNGYDSDEQTLMGAYVSAGDTVVVPDYEGERLDWGAGQESGYGTLDGIRATENMLKLPAATTPVGIIGYSGGAIATEFASELAPSYSPNLDVVGIAEGGIPVDFAHNLDYINGSPSWSGVIPAVLIGVGRAFNLNFGPYTSAYGEKINDQIQDQCINNFYGNYPGLKIQQLMKPAYTTPFAIPIFDKITNHLIMSTDGTPKGPLYMVVGDADGTGDGVMVTQDVEALAHTYCQRGVSVQFTVEHGDDHTEAAIPFEENAITFLTDRLDGVPVANGCSSIGVGNSLAPLPVPSAQLRYLGARKKSHGLLAYLRTPVGTLDSLVIQLRHNGRVVGKLSVAAVTSTRHRLVLRAHGRMPRAGRYTIFVIQGQMTLAKRKIRVR
jgi:Secretory lipase